MTHTDPPTLAVCYALLCPIWRDMCAAIKRAIDENPKYRLKEEDVAYFSFFSQELSDMGVMVDEILAVADRAQREFGTGALVQEQPHHKSSKTYKRVKDCVRMLQHYLLEFWDAVYEEAFIS